MPRCLVVSQKVQEALKTTEEYKEGFPVQFFLPSHLGINDPEQTTWSALNMTGRLSRPCSWRPWHRQQRHCFVFDLSVGLAEAAVMKAARLCDVSGGTGDEVMLA